MFPLRSRVISLFIESVLFSVALFISVMVEPAWAASIALAKVLYSTPLTLYAGSFKSSLDTIVPLPQSLPEISYVTPSANEVAFITSPSPSPVANAIVGMKLTTMASVRTTAKIFFFIVFLLFVRHKLRVWINLKSVIPYG